MKRLIVALCVLGVFAVARSAFAGTIDTADQIGLPASTTTTSRNGQAIPPTAMVYSSHSAGALFLSFDTNTWNPANNLTSQSSSGFDSPEPTALLMLGTGFVGLAAVMRRKCLKE